MKNRIRNPARNKTEQQMQDISIILKDAARIKNPGIRLAKYDSTLEKNQLTPYPDELEPAQEPLFQEMRAFTLGPVAKESTDGDEME